MAVERYKRVRKIGPNQSQTFFVKGGDRPTNAGRKAGVPNKNTRILKDALLLAAELEGSDTRGKDGLVGFLRSAARTDRASFLTLLGRVLPLQINAKVTTPQTVPERFSNTNLATMTLAEKMAAMREMIGMTQPLPPPAPKEQDSGGGASSMDSYTEGEFTEVPAQEAAE